jgi:hypothetical protein
MRTSTNRPDYLSLLKEANQAFCEAARQVATDHSENAEVVHGSQLMQQIATEANDQLQAFIEKYGSVENKEPCSLKKTLFARRRFGDFGLLRELHDLYLLATEIYVINSAVLDGAKELRDHALLCYCQWLEGQSDRQKIWCMTQVKENAAQSLVVPQ